MEALPAKPPSSVPGFMGSNARAPFQWLIDSAFAHRPPRPDQVEQCEAIGAKAKDFAEFLRDSCQDGAIEELRIALEKIREAVMWAHAAIARSG